MIGHFSLIDKTADLFSPKTGVRTGFFHGSECSKINLPSQTLSRMFPGRRQRADRSAARQTPFARTHTLPYPFPVRPSPAARPPASARARPAKAGQSTESASGSRLQKKCAGNEFSKRIRKQRERPRPPRNGCQEKVNSCVDCREDFAVNGVPK